MKHRISKGRLFKKMSHWKAEGRRIPKRFLRAYGESIEFYKITIDENCRVSDTLKVLPKYPYATKTEPTLPKKTDKSRTIDKPKFTQADGKSKFAPSPENATKPEKKEAPKETPKPVEAKAEATGTAKKEVFGKGSKASEAAKVEPKKVDKPKANKPKSTD